MTSTDPWLNAIIERFQTDKRIAEKAMAQLSDEQFRRRPAPGFNSVATIVRHVSGNLLSRWTDFLTSDGDKPDRDREGEFEDWPGSREELMQCWERGFETLFASLRALSPGDVTKIVNIRNVPHTVAQAVVRGLEHTSYHVGQILYLSRLMHSGKWEFVTIAPGASRDVKR